MSEQTYSHVDTVLLRQLSRVPLAGCSTDPLGCVCTCPLLYICLGPGLLLALALGNGLLWDAALDRSQSIYMHNSY
jgi:hypothetical protein